MKDILITINRETRMVNLNKSTIGNDGESLQAKLIFSFEDEFVDGQARLEYTIGGNSHYAMVKKVGETYELPVLPMLTKVGQIDMQLVISSGTEEELSVFKSKMFYLYCNKSINTLIEEVPEYPAWIEVANAKLDALDKVGATVEKVDNVSTLRITKSDGSVETVEILDGEVGPTGPQGERGIQGIQGPQGIQGIQGPQGEQGPAGADGQPGKDGQDGAPGKDGAIQYEAGENIKIEGNVISANIPKTTGTVYDISIASTTTALSLGEDEIHNNITSFLTDILNEKEYDLFASTPTGNVKYTYINETLSKLYITLSGTRAPIKITTIDYGTNSTYILFRIQLVGFIQQETGQSSSSPSTMTYLAFIDNPYYGVYISKEEILNKRIQNVYSNSGLSAKYSVQPSGSKKYVPTSTYQCLPTNNTKVWEPTGDYNPATKKYVDNAIASAITTTLEGEY